MNTTQEAPPSPVTAAADAPPPAPPAAFQPLRLNLLHEQQAAHAQSKRDPLKLGLYALAGVAALLVAYYVFRLSGSSSLQTQLRARQAEFSQKYEKQLKTADTREKDLNTLVASGTALNTRIEGRFYWAPVLEIIAKVVPREVQFISLTGTNENKDGVRNVGLTLEGIAAGAEPRDAAERLRVALADSLGKAYPGATASFRSLDDGDATVTLDGKTLRTSKFTITIGLRRGGAPAANAAAAPAPAR